MRTSSVNWIHTYSDESLETNVESMTWPVFSDLKKRKTTSLRVKTLFGDDKSRWVNPESPENLGHRLHPHLIACSHVQRLEPHAIRFSLSRCHQVCSLPYPNSVLLTAHGKILKNQTPHQIFQYYGSILKILRRNPTIARPCWVRRRLESTMKCWRIERECLRRWKRSQRREGGEKKGHAVKDEELMFGLRHLVGQNKHLN